MLNRSLLFFLYSAANIMGCIWALIGLTSFFYLKETMWLLLVPVLYGTGYLISPKEDLTEHWQTGNELSARDLKIQLEALIKKISKRVAQAELEKVIAIKDNILILLPHLEEMNVADYDFHIIKQTVVDYLPQMLSTYLELPPAFAKLHKIRNGKTSQETLIEQLTILDNQINQIVISVNSKDAEALIAQSEFLKSKFVEDKNWI